MDQLRTFMVRTVCVWPHKVTLRSECDRVHSWYGVDSIPQSHSKSFLCTLYTVQDDSFGWFCVSFVQSTEYSARLFLQSSELGPPCPLNRRRVCPPSFVWGGGAHLPACEGVTLRSWCDRIKWPYGVKKISIKWLWPVKVTLKVIKRPLMVSCWSCDGVPLKWNKKNCRASSLSLRIKWAYSRLSIRMIGQYL